MFDSRFNSQKTGIIQKTSIQQLHKQFVVTVTRFDMQQFVLSKSNTIFSCNFLSKKHEKKALSLQSKIGIG
jgi:hypothetical protein